MTRPLHPNPDLIPDPDPDLIPGPDHKTKALVDHPSIYAPTVRF